jgi:hypothetical protein
MLCWSKGSGTTLPKHAAPRRSPGPLHSIATILPAYDDRIQELPLSTFLKSMRDGQRFGKIKRVLARSATRPSARLNYAGQA